MTANAAQKHSFMTVPLLFESELRATMNDGSDLQRFPGGGETNAGTSGLVQLVPSTDTIIPAGEGILYPHKPGRNITSCDFADD
jgi:hypothetical protein